MACRNVGSGTQLAFELDKSPREQAFKIAKDVYRSLILRGDSIEYTIKTHYGGTHEEYEFSTGYYLWTNDDVRVKIPSGKVGIKLESNGSIHIFSLKEIYSAVLKEEVKL
ncbi:MAG: hypothetical protein PHO67_07800 [Candidatus Omnitrophica bacterium]|nr:hypothetical protein [Candidatus Omnitrophota bacterium]